RRGRRRDQEFLQLRATHHVALDQWRLYNRLRGFGAGPVRYRRLPGWRRHHSRPRATPDGGRREHGVLEIAFARWSARRRRLDVQRLGHRPGSLRLSHRPARVTRSGAAGRVADRAVARWSLRAGHVAHGQQGDAECRLALGTISWTERDERRGLQLQPRQLPERREEPGIPQRARRSDLSRRRWLSVWEHRARQAVAKCFAARWPRVGRNG